MNWDRIQGNWKHVVGKVLTRWGKLNDDDFDVIAGQRDPLLGKIHERYGVAKEAAESQLSEWADTADDSWMEELRAKHH